MKKQYFQSQYILNQVFENQDRILRTTMNTSQDYLNAVFDEGRNALRVNVGGAMLPMVPDVDSLPPSGEDHQLCPVYNEEKKSVDFYEYDKSKGEWIYRGGTMSLTKEEKESLGWLNDNLDLLKRFVDSNYVVNVEEITLPRGSTKVMVQGVEQDIDDDLDMDADHTTPYRIDVRGYILNVSTYKDAAAPIPDVYYTQVTYESSGGGYGTSHVFMQQEEYEYFSGLPDGKNIMRAYYIVPATKSPVMMAGYVLNGDGTVTDSDGNVLSLSDEGDRDGDPDTPYRLDVPGYAVGVSTFVSGEAKVATKYYAKLAYESDGVKSGRSSVFMDKTEYDFFSGLGPGRNMLNVYYLESMYPGSVGIGEFEFMFPYKSAELVLVDSKGNVHDISDPDSGDGGGDGDMDTMVRIRVDGFAVDMDGYYDADEPIKHRLIVKMSYDMGLDRTDIYVGKDYYDYVSGLGNGRNRVSVYVIGAGAGVDTNQIMQTDSALDGTSVKPIQNRAVKEAVDALSREISELRRSISGK